MTAVEWLDEQIQERVIAQDVVARNMIIEISMEDYMDIKRQAKEMEKQQIIDAFDEGKEYDYHINGAPKFDSETYFAETYGETLKDNHIVDTTEMVEISDEEIYNAANDIFGRDSRNIQFKAGAKWYREQLRQHK